MTWVNIIVLLILFFSFIGGLREGAVKSLSSSIILIVSLPLAGISYRFVADFLSFLPGEDWENFIGFLVTLGVINILLTLIFLLPRRAIEKTWNKGIPFRLIGGLLTVFNTAIGLVVFALVLGAYPIFAWLEDVVAGSVVLSWLVVHLGFIQALLPEVFRTGSGAQATLSILLG